MPIVIGEFEIVPEQQPAEPERSADTEGLAPVRLPTPHELALALRHQERREARVRAD